MFRSDRCDACLGTLPADCVSVYSLHDDVKRFCADCFYKQKLDYQKAFLAGAQFERKRILGILRLVGTTDLLPDNLADFIEGLLGYEDDEL